MKLPLLLGFASVLLFAVILGSFHHHKDLAVHPDCSICIFVHQADSTVPAAPTISTIILPVLSPLFHLPVLTVPGVMPTLDLLSRPPPSQ
jgi:hypothetical protein